MLKRYLTIIVSVFLLNATHGQAPGRQRPEPAYADLPTFNLDFPGGNPEILIEHINAALPNSPVNAIIPSEYNDIEIPEMKLKNVTVQQVFEALSRASQKNVNYVTGWAEQGGVRRASIQTFTSSYSFQANPPIQTNSVWYFVVQKPPQQEEEQVCRFYQLGPHLQQGLNINDITTAIQAGYKMLKEPEPPELNFHEETQLLIAVGPSSKLKLIEEVLSQLPKPKAVEPDKAEKPKA